MIGFKDLNLAAPLLAALEAEGYEKPTPIQEKAIPPALLGRDLLGCAQTGTGKTAAFALPILQRLAGAPARRGRRPFRALILTPTRELAAQIGDSFAAYGRNTGLQHAVIFGGVNQRPQVDRLKRGVDILVATPGRLLDLTNQGFIDYFALEVFVLDEADRMLDMGFIHDVRRIVGLIPKKRQTLFFSATMPEEIRDLSASILSDPDHVSVTPPSSTVDLIEQSVYFVEKQDKPELLVHLFKDRSLSRTLVFTRTKYGADKVTRRLNRAGVSAKAIHGNKAQNARQSALDDFKSGEIRVLVATDIASRGIDVDNVTHVINFDLPNEPESYVHRIGRTGRAGSAGKAISFCAVDERPYLVDIERLIKKWVPRELNHPYPSPIDQPATTDLEPKKRQGGQPSRPSPARRPIGGGRDQRSGDRPQAGGANPNAGEGSGDSRRRRRRPRRRPQEAAGERR